MSKTAIIVLNTSGLDTALHIRSALPHSEIWGLKKRVKNADRSFNDLTSTLPALLSKGYTIIGICAAGILIRILAPTLSNKRTEPPVLAVSEDGETIVPLLGGLTGGNELAHTLGQSLNAYAAITGSGARKFGIALEAPPEGYILANPSQAKQITSSLLSGQTMRLQGKAPWLETSGLTPSEDGIIPITISWKDDDAPENGLLYYPACIAIGIKNPNDIDIDSILTDLKRFNIAPHAVASLLLPADTSPYKLKKSLEQDHAQAFAFTPDNAIRFADHQTMTPTVMRETLTQGWASCEETFETDALIIAVTSAPIDIERFGRPAGKLYIIGVGPGSLKKMTLESHDCLMECSDWVGYSTYLTLIKDLSPDKIHHSSGNRVETDRAREALELAAQGKKVALVTSGDPGIFAMASAVMEVLEQSSLALSQADNTGDLQQKAWPEVSLSILPGVSAMQTASSKAGAILGHDFCAISLSDIRKPWAIIESRLKAALDADMVIALYNPASKTRKKQIQKAIDLITAHHNPQTPVLIGKNLERSDEELHLIELGNIDVSLIDMRTILIFGSSKSRTLSWSDHAKFIYTPRSYE